MSILEYAWAGEYASIYTEDFLDNFDWIKKKVYQKIGFIIQDLFN